MNDRIKTATTPFEQTKIDVVESVLKKWALTHGLLHMHKHYDISLIC